MINLGDKVRDKLSGFEGIAVGRCEYLYEATKILVLPKGVNDNGYPKEVAWLEMDRLEVVQMLAVTGFADVAGRRVPQEP